MRVIEKGCLKIAKHFRLQKMSGGIFCPIWVTIIKCDGKINVQFIAKRVFYQPSVALVFSGLLKYDKRYRP